MGHSLHWYNKTKLIVLKNQTNARENICSSACTKPYSIFKMPNAYTTKSRYIFTYFVDE